MASSKTIALKIALNGEREFRAAMQAVKKETGLLGTELKNLAAKYSDNANSMEALRAKQAKLADAQDAYTKRVKAASDGLENAKKNEQEQAQRLEELRDQLEKAREEMAKMEAAGDKTSDAYKEQAEAVDKLTKEVNDQVVVHAKAEGAVSDWRKELSNASAGLDEINKEIELNDKYLEEAARSADGCATSIDQFGKEVDETADDIADAAESTEKFSVSIGDMVKNKLIDMAGDALMNLGRKAIEAAKYVVEVGQSFEAQMSKVAAISGASGPDLDALTEKAAEMGRTTKFTATEAGEALEYMAMAGWKTEDMLDGLEGVMYLAAASGEDLGTTSDIVTDALTALGMEASESGHFADVLAVASTNANTNVGMMGETFKYVGAIAGSLHYSSEDLAEAIGLVANAGIKSSQAGTGLRSIITRLATDAGSSSKSLGALGTLTEKLGVEFYNADGSARGLNEVLSEARVAWQQLTAEEQSNYGKKIAGQNAITTWNALMNASAEDVAKLETALANCDGTAERMSTTMNNNVAGSMTILNSALEGLAIAAYDLIDGPLNGAIKFLTDIVGGITNLIAPPKTELEKFISDISAANEQVEASIEHAKATKENADINDGVLEEAKDFLLDLLDAEGEFNRIDLGNGRFEVLDTTGKLIAEGFEPLQTSIGETDQSLQDFGKEGIGISKEQAAEAVSAVVSVFDGATVQIDEFAVKVSESGDIEIPTSGLGIEQGTQAIVHLYNAAGEEIGQFEEQIAESGNIEINTEKVESEMERYLSMFSVSEIDSFRQAVEKSGDVVVTTDGVKKAPTPSYSISPTQAKRSMNTRQR